MHHHGVALEPEHATPDAAGAVLDHQARDRLHVRVHGADPPGAVDRAGQDAAVGVASAGHGQER